MANQPKDEPIVLPISTTITIDATKLRTLKTAYENSGGAAKEAAFANLKAFKTELYGRIDGELLAYGNIAKREVDKHLGI